MGLPTIPDITPKIDIQREDVINLFLASIAMEEMSLSHIMDAEAQNAQCLLGMFDGQNSTPPSIDDLIKINDCMDQILDKVNKNQMLLHVKLRDILTLIGAVDYKSNISGIGIFTAAESAFHELDATSPALQYTYRPAALPDAEQEIEYKFIANPFTVVYGFSDQTAGIKGAGDISIQDESGKRKMLGIFSLSVIDGGIGEDTFRIFIKSNDESFEFDSGTVKINKGDLIVLWS